MIPRPERYLLLLDHTGLGAWHGGRAGLTEIAHFADDDEGVRRFAHWLSTQPRQRSYTVLADLAEESLEVDILPRSRGADRKALLQRRLAQHFPATPYTTTLSLGLTRDTPVCETVLLAALPRAASLTPWADALAAQRVSLTGIHGTALALDRLVCRMARRHRQLRGSFLLASATPSGVRHTYFHDGRLRFSRLLAGNEAEPLQRSRAHLLARGLIDRDDAPLAVIALGNAHCADDGCAHSTLALPSGRDSVGPALLQALFRQLARGDHNSDYAPASLRHLGRHHRLDRHLHAGGLAAGALCGALALPLWIDNRASATDLGALRALAARQAADYRALQDSLPALPAPPPALRALLASAGQQRRRHIDPRPLLSILSGALDAYPGVVLSRLHWRRANGPSTTDEGRLVLDFDAGAAPPTADSGASTATILNRFLTDLGNHDGVRVHQRHGITSTSGSPNGASGTSARHVRIELVGALAGRAPW